jgi:hypothetical protein
MNIQFWRRTCLGLVILILVVLVAEEWRVGRILSEATAQRRKAVTTGMINLTGCQLELDQVRIQSELYKLQRDMMTQRLYRVSERY